jgi:hypothetical protein
MTSLKNIFNLLDKNLTVDTFKVSGIYFFIKDNEIIYIGKSLDVIRRVRHHDHKNKFDHFRVIQCDPDKLDFYEKRLIFFFKPKLNIQFKNKFKKHAGIITTGLVDLFNIQAVYNETLALTDIPYNEVRLAINGIDTGLTDQQKESLLYVIREGSKQAIEKILKS